MSEAELARNRPPRPARDPLTIKKSESSDMQSAIAEQMQSSGSEAATAVPSSTDPTAAAQKERPPRPTRPVSPMFAQSSVNPSEKPLGSSHASDGAVNKDGKTELAENGEEVKEKPVKPRKKKGTGAKKVIAVDKNAPGSRSMSALSFRKPGATETPTQQKLSTLLRDSRKEAHLQPGDAADVNEVPPTTVAAGDRPKKKKKKPAKTVEDVGLVNEKTQKTTAENAEKPVKRSTSKRSLKLSLNSLTSESRDSVSPRMEADESTESSTRTLSKSARGPPPAIPSLVPTLPMAHVDSASSESGAVASRTLSASQSGLSMSPRFGSPRGSVPPAMRSLPAPNPANGSPLNASSSGLARASSPENRGTVIRGPASGSANSNTEYVNVAGCEGGKSEVGNLALTVPKSPRNREDGNGSNVKTQSDDSSHDSNERSSSGSRDNSQDSAIPRPAPGVRTVRRPPAPSNALPPVPTNALPALPPDVSAHGALPPVPIANVSILPSATSNEPVRDQKEGRLPKSKSDSSGLTDLGNAGTGDAEAKHVVESRSSSTDVDNLIRTRYSIVSELVQTEKDYLRDIGVIVDIILPGLRTCEHFSMEDVDVIFMPRTLVILYQLSKELNLSLDGVENLSFDEQDVGKRFVESGLTRSLLVYNQYCSNQPQSNDRLAQIRNSNAKAVTFLEELRADSQCRSLDLESFLIKPLQRVTKYPLLFRELLKYTPSNHADFENLTKCHADLEAIVSRINEAKRQAEGLNKLLDIESKLKFKGVTAFKLVSPTRRYIMDDAFDRVRVGTTQYRNCDLFLFNDCVLMCENKGKKLAPRTPLLRLQDVLVWDVTSAEGVDAFSIVSQDRTVSPSEGKLVVMCASKDMKENWMSKLSECIATNMFAVKNSTSGVVLSRNR